MNMLIGRSLLVLVLFFGVLIEEKLLFAGAPAKGVSNSTNSSAIRALHVVSRNSTLTDMRRVLDQASDAHLNTVVLGICWRGSTKLDSTPWVSGKGYWNKKELYDVVEYSRSKGIQVIPEIKLLTHQEVFLENAHPELMYNAVTYDPRNPKLYEIVLPVLNEIIELLRPRAILIGHDEIAGWNAKQARKLLTPGEKPLPADLFLKDVLKIHNFLKERKVETWMWGDMLLSPDEFPSMLALYMHGTISGYGKALRNKLPKDIVIADWHYEDEGEEFPSLAALRKEGFRVLGATWKNENTIKKFSRFAAQNGADGMIATTWFHVPRKEWDLVERIIRESGETFMRDFPDAK